MKAGLSYPVALCRAGGGITVIGRNGARFDSSPKNERRRYRGKMTVGRISVIPFAIAMGAVGRAATQLWCVICRYGATAPY